MAARNQKEIGQKEKPHEKILSFSQNWGFFFCLQNTCVSEPEKQDTLNNYKTPHLSHVTSLWASIFHRIKKPKWRGERQVSSSRRHRGFIPSSPLNKTLERLRGCCLGRRKLVLNRISIVRRKSISNRKGRDAMNFRDKTLLTQNTNS